MVVRYTYVHSIELALREIERSWELHEQMSRVVERPFDEKGSQFEYRNSSTSCLSHHVVYGNACWVWEE